MVSFPSGYNGATASGLPGSAYSLVASARMGRKGSGRKGFMKSVRAAGSESDDELTSGNQAGSDPGGPAVPADPNLLGVRMQADPEADSPTSPDQLAPVKTSTQSSAAGADESSTVRDHNELKAGEQSSSGQDADDELETTETLGQLTQRHRRVSNAATAARGFHQSTKPSYQIFNFCRSSSCTRSG